MDKLYFMENPMNKWKIWGEETTYSWFNTPTLTLVEYPQKNPTSELHLEPKFLPKKSEM